MYSSLCLPVGMYESFDKMYHSCVVPIIDYGCVIWGYKQYGDGDKI